MSDDDTTLAPSPHRPREWRRAVRALRALLDDPDDTIRAFEVFDALDRNVEERSFRRFRREPSGHDLLATRPSLAAVLSDRAGLAVLPAGSFGRAYLAYLDANGFDPLGLVALKSRLEADVRARGEQRPVLDEARAWFRERSILMHDLWHLLTGYDTDDLGEAALLAFSWAQTGGVATGLLVIGAGWRGSMLIGPSFVPYLWRAWRRGRRAGWLTALPFERLLSAPLTAVQRAAGIAAPEDVHPGGMPRAAWMRVRGTPRAGIE